MGPLSNSGRGSWAPGAPSKDDSRAATCHSTGPLGPAFGAVYTVVPGLMAETGLGRGYGSLGEAGTRAMWALLGTESPAIGEAPCMGRCVGVGEAVLDGTGELGCGTSSPGLSAGAQSADDVLWEW